MIDTFSSNIPSRQPIPVLYSFRRCPYAMRARMAIRYAGITVELREVELKNKPPEMLAASSKGTVPVLVDTDGSVIDESLDIMLWALQKNDPDNWLDSTTSNQTIALIKQNDEDFKGWLDRYKYHIGYPEHPPEYYRERCEAFFSILETLLLHNRYLLGSALSVADIAIFPFIRQCAFVNRPWFDSAPYPSLQNWLNNLLQSDLFISVMDKYEPWRQSQNKAFVF